MKQKVSFPVSNTVKGWALDKTMNQVNDNPHFKENMTKNVGGTIGEISTFYYLNDELGLNVQFEKDEELLRHYDILSANQIRVEVKTQLLASGLEPRWEWNCHVARNYTDQQCDIYLFTFLNVPRENHAWGDIMNADNIWFMGWITKTDFLHKSVFLQKGQARSEKDKPMEMDCDTVFANELNSMQSLTHILKP